MGGRHGNKHKKKLAEHRPVSAPANSETQCQEHPDNREEEHMTVTHNPPSSLKDWRVDIAIFISLIALFASFWQACLMRKAMRVDQRAWVSVPFPANFPLDGKFIPIITQVKNSGKTPARDVQGDIIATVLKKGEQPTIGDFSVGHPHEHLFGGSIFPDAPFPMTPIVKRYGDHAPEIVVPDEALRNDIASGERFIIFYGRITYSDAFGISHWTQFCTGSGAGILDNLKKCVTYNDFDPNEE